MNTPYYEKHLFICTNQKGEGKKCCANASAEDMFDYVKKQLQARDMYGPEKIRVSKSGCLGRCELGPCIVIYPEGAWYRYETRADIDMIIEEHCIKGIIVERLQLR